MEYLKEFSERLRELMDDTDYTQEKISKLTGCGHGSVSRWLNAEYFPSMRNIIKLSDCFGCSIDYLLGRTDVKAIKSEIVSTFPERLQLLVAEKNKSLLKIAKELDIDNAILYRWNNGVYLPGVHGLIMLADYFLCSVDFLIGRDE